MRRSCSLVSIKHGQYFMKTKCPTPVGPRRTALAAAIAIALCGPVYAADQGPQTSQYDAAVNYADYRDQQGSYKLRASDLIGRDIHNADNDEIGEIDDLIVSRDGDKVMAIVSLGGFFDLGSKLVAIPYQDLRVTKDGKRVYYNATKAELEARSEFTYADSEHPAKAKPAHEKLSAVDSRRPSAVTKDDVNQSSGDTNRTVADRPAVSKTKPADNSAHNAHDVAGDALTPLDQSHAAADVDITRSIRKVLVDDGTLGTNAQNVKVITVDGMVTLRGAVANANEQARIVAIAKEAAGLDHVQDELEVIKR